MSNVVPRWYWDRDSEISVGYDEIGDLVLEIPGSEPQLIGSIERAKSVRDVLDAAIKSHEATGKEGT